MDPRRGPRRRRPARACPSRPRGRAAWRSCRAPCRARPGRSRRRRRPSRPGRRSARSRAPSGRSRALLPSRSPYPSLFPRVVRTFGPGRLGPAGWIKPRPRPRASRASLAERRQAAHRDGPSPSARRSRRRRRSAGMSTPCSSRSPTRASNTRTARVAGLDLVDVAEVLEDLDDRAEDHLDRVAALVGLEDHRAAEGRVGANSSSACSEVLGLGGGTEGIASHRAQPYCARVSDASRRARR